MKRRVVIVVSETAANAASIKKFFEKRCMLCHKVAKRHRVSKNLRAIKEVLNAINNVRTIKQSVNCDDYK